MAKAKKTDGAVSASAAKKKGAPPKAKQAGKPAAAEQSTLVDTGLAAMNAAKMLASKAKLGGASEAQTPAPKESNAFKQMKEGLNKPAAHSVNAAMGNAFGPSKSNLPTHGFNKQTAHNQTQGGFNKINVPRRTGG